MSITIMKKPIALPRLISVTKTSATVSGGLFGGDTYTINGLLTNGTDNPKTAKNDYAGMTRCVSMLPHTLGGIGNLCPFADDCALSCLAFTGRGSLPTTHRARLARTMAFQLARDWAIDRITQQLTTAQRVADRKGEKLFVRLNMLTDFPWESTGIIDDFPRINFYDYSKNPNRAGRVRPNYWVTFSRGSSNDSAVAEVLSRGCNVAAVFHNVGGKCGRYAHQQTLPARIRINGQAHNVIDGGLTDLRQFDQRDRRQGGRSATGPVVVGLRLLAHTREKRQTAIDSGFSIQYPFQDRALCV